MKIDPNDPRLTAYALGEMPAAERAAFERELAGDPAARAEIEAIRALGDSIGEELRQEAAPALTAAQRDAIARAPRRGVPLVWKLVPLAACLALVAGIAYLVTRPPDIVVDHEAREAREAVRVRLPGEPQVKPEEARYGTPAEAAPGDTPASGSTVRSASSPASGMASNGSPSKWPLTRSPSFMPVSIPVWPPPTAARS